MHIVKAFIFSALLLCALFVTLYYGMGWGLSKIVVLIAIGSVFIAFSCWGYKKMYSDDE